MVKLLERIRSGNGALELRLDELEEASESRWRNLNGTMGPMVDSLDMDVLDGDAHLLEASEMALSEWSLVSSSTLCGPSAVRLLFDGSEVVMICGMRKEEERDEPGELAIRLLRVEPWLCEAGAWNLSDFERFCEELEAAASDFS